MAKVSISIFPLKQPVFSLVLRDHFKQFLIYKRLYMQVSRLMELGTRILTDENIISLF